MKMWLSDKAAKAWRENQLVYEANHYYKCTSVQDVYEDETGDLFELPAGSIVRCVTVKRSSHPARGLYAVLRARLAPGYVTDVRLRLSERGNGPAGVIHVSPLEALALVEDEELA